MKYSKQLTLFSMLIATARHRLKFKKNSTVQKFVGKYFYIRRLKRQSLIRDG
jgi:hypothetical protein